MKKNGLRTGAFALVAASLLGLAAWRALGTRAARDQSRNQPTSAAAPVSVAIATPRDIVERVTFTGVIRPFNEVDIFTRVPGRVEEVRVRVGDHVEKDHILAIIEHRESTLHNEQAQAQLQVALAGLERARIGLEAATVAYQRQAALRSQDVVPQAAFEQVESAFREARAGAMAAEAQVTTARAAAALAAEGVRNSRITTPIAGTVTRRLVNVGTQAAPGVPLLRVQDVATIKVESTASASEFARLRIGQDVSISVSDLPADVFPGRVSTLSPSLDPQTRRAAVEIVVSNLDGRLLPNMFAQAVVEVGRKSAVLAIPESAIVSSSSGRAIFVVRDGKAMEIRPRLGGTDTGFIAVESDLGAGERVVVAGQTSIRSGVIVRAVSEEPKEAASR